MKMEIGERTDSDHRPIEVTLEKTVTRNKRQEKKHHEIEDWSEEGCRKYKQKLKERIESAFGRKDDWTDLAKEIRKAIQKKRIKKRETVPGRRM